MSIEICGVSKTFGSYRALRDIDLEIASGELVALLGPSGSGKTTLLRIIAGLEAADRGAILFHGEDATHRNVRERQVGFVFQHYALFRHMTVFENVAFGLRVRPKRLRPQEREVRERVGELLKLVQIDWLANRYPSQLSGGQRQRVALARALAIEPKILLLDEPFGALDANIRQELRRWLRRLHDELQITSVFVTHDQEEALEVADRVVVMNEGRIEQMGVPEEVYDHPATPFVYRFLGNVNIFHGRVHQGKMSLGDGEFEALDHLATHDSLVVGYVRPHDMEIERHRDGAEAIEALVCHIHAIGPVVRLELKGRHTHEPIEVEMSKDRFNELGLTAGEHVFVSPKNLRVFVEDYSI
ncbi:MAG: sulfate ABC transporter ATP-binding protein [Armatimonadetes bacterium]|nr:sulfate ABC transporter ATP-binding protein [Armatimonadota bacterium]